MSASQGIEFKLDDRALIRAIERAGSERALEVLAAGVYDGTVLIRDEAMRNAPDSGLSPGDPRKKIRGKQYNLKLSKDIIVKNVQIRSTTLIGRVVALPFYAAMIERGTSKIAKNPFMRRATESKRSAAVAKFQDTVQKMLQEAFR
jgi:hypothetical protein